MKDSNLDPIKRTRPLSVSHRLMWCTRRSCTVWIGGAWNTTSATNLYALTDALRKGQVHCKDQCRVGSGTPHIPSHRLLWCSTLNHTARVVAQCKKYPSRIWAANEPNQHSNWCGACGASHCKGQCGWRKWGRFKIQTPDAPTHSVGMNKPHHKDPWVTNRSKEELAMNSTNHMRPHVHRLNVVQHEALHRKGRCTRDREEQGPWTKHLNFQSIDISTYAMKQCEILGGIDLPHGQTISNISSPKLTPSCGIENKRHKKEILRLTQRSQDRFTTIWGVWGAKITKEKVTKYPCITPSKKSPSNHSQIKELKNQPKRLQNKKNKTLGNQRGDKWRLPNLCWYFIMSLRRRHVSVSM
jgi:hypothetical protein